MRSSRTPFAAMPVFAFIASSLLTLVILTSYTQAAVYCVDDDNRNATPDGTARNPFASIQTAIVSCSDFDTIKVAVGSYKNFTNLGKPLTILGGYVGASTANYTAGMTGDFNQRGSNPLATVVSGGADSIGVNLTRFSSDPFSFVVDNFNIKDSKKGVVFDVAVSFPHVENVTISNNIIETNGQKGVTTLGAGLFVSGVNNRILNNIIRNNLGGRGAGVCGNLTNDSILIEGNQIIGNTGYDDHCGGVYLGGYAVLRRNVIADNRLEFDYGWGGGILILGTAYMSYNIIKNNYCPTYGGGLFVDEGGTAYLDHELIINNRAGTNGAAVAIDDGVPGSSRITLTNCTIANNTSFGDLGGNALFVDNGSFATVKNCICYGNGDDFFVLNSSVLNVSYTLSAEATSGVGNISMDPLFADINKSDYHLKSTRGRYDPTSLTWIIDDVYSPAIDAGDPSNDYKTEPSPNGNRINMGCYGNTSQASKSLLASGVAESNELHSMFCTLTPNPCRGMPTLTFQTPVTHSLEIDVHNVVGQRVYHGDIQGQSTVLRLDSSPGLYFYTVLEMGVSVTSGTIVVE